MPIEIKELVIRARIDGKGPNGTKGENKMTGRKGESAMKQEIVAECVEQVLEILRRKRER